ncbi:hypothetical protein FKM82_029019 [Ascaphus truei]
MEARGVSISHLLKTGSTVSEARLPTPTLSFPNRMGLWERISSTRDPSPRKRQPTFDSAHCTQPVGMDIRK